VPDDIAPTELPYTMNLDPTQIPPLPGLRTRRERRGCHRCVPWAVSLSLGSLAVIICASRLS
jgi:hypothetical protein